MKEILEEYKTWLELQGKSNNTIKTYFIPIKKFLEYFQNIKKEKNINIEYLKENIDKNIVLKFLTEIKTKNNIDPNTLRLYLRALSSFFKFIEKPEIIKGIKAPKIEKRLPKYITLEEFNKILSVVKKKRDRLILLLLFYTGIRVSELINLKKEDILLKEGFIRVFGKGKKERIIPIPKFLIKELEDYIKIIKSERIFEISARQVERLIKKYSSMSNINKKVTPHILRHSLATLLLSNGVDIRYIQEILGHSSLSITQIYTHVVPSKLKEIYEKVIENIKIS